MLSTITPAQNKIEHYCMINTRLSIFMDFFGNKIYYWR